MFEWKIEETRLMKEYDDKDMSECKWQRFDAEDISREEKIAYIDSRSEGRMSAVLKLYEKYMAEKDGLKRDKYGCIKSVSFDAWVKRNTKDMPVRCINDGRVWFPWCAGMDRRFATLNHKGWFDTYDDIVDEVFRRLLMDHVRDERKWFAAHDEYSVLSKKLAHSPYFSLLCEEAEPEMYVDDACDRIVYEDESGEYVKLGIEELRFLSDACDGLKTHIREYSKKIAADFTKMMNGSD